MKSFVRMLNLILFNVMILLVRKITALLDFFYPKDDKTIVFGSDATNRLSGDPKAMFEEMRRNHRNYHVYFITKTPREKGHIQSNSLSSLFIFLRARYIVSSHTNRDFGYFGFSRRTKLIATWHAITMKSVGYAKRNRTSWMKKELEGYTKNVEAFIACSKYDAAIHSLMFGYGGRTYLTGHPRNDHLVNHKSSNKGKLQKLLGNISGEETIILYAPTFRTLEIPVTGLKGRLFPEVRTKDTGVKLFPFVDFDIDALNRFLKENNILILLRMHIGDQTSQLNLDIDRIITFDYHICPDINLILEDIDFVVTDYSSIVYDYLLLNRPMIFIPYDLEEYKKVRGLVVDDYDFWTPGPKVSSLSDFIDYIRLCINGSSDPYEPRRREINKIINSCQTDDSTSRILHVLKLLR